MRRRQKLTLLCALLCAALPPLCACTRRQKCSLTHLIAPSKGVRSTSGAASATVLETRLRSGAANAELSLLTRFRVRDSEADSVNLFEAVLRRGKTDVLLLVRVRFDRADSRLVVETREGAAQLKSHAVPATAPRPGEWYYLALGLDFVRGNGGVFLARDHLQSAGPGRRYLFPGADPDLDAAVPRTAPGEAGNSNCRLVDPRTNPSPERLRSRLGAADPGLCALCPRQVGAIEPCV